MPHSSGGGSHGGGTHSGSSSHHSRSSSSGHSSSSGSNGEPGYDFHRISSKPYDGASKYVYYDRKGQYHYVYKAGANTAPALSDVIVIWIIMSIIAGPIIYFMLALGIYSPRQIDVNSYNANIVIEDTTGLIDGDIIQPAMEEMLDKTGVAPGLKVVYDSDWKTNYKDLETYAYSEYLRMYDDENHWLVVVSYPDDYAQSDFTEWSWEGMNGDDNYPALNSKSEAEFTEIFHKHMLRSQPDKISQNIANAYDEFSEVAMGIQLSKGCVIVAVIIGIIYLVIILAFFRAFLNGKKMKKCFAVPKLVREYNCEYCGTKYVYDTVKNCPSCAAPIPVHNDLQPET